MIHLEYRPTAPEGFMAHSPYLVRFDHVSAKQDAVRTSLRQVLPSKSCFPDQLPLTSLKLQSLREPCYEVELEKEEGRIAKKRKRAAGRGQAADAGRGRGQAAKAGRGRGRARGRGGRCQIQDQDAQELPGHDEKEQDAHELPVHDEKLEDAQELPVHDEKGHQPGLTRRTSRLQRLSKPKAAAKAPVLQEPGDGLKKGPRSSKAMEALRDLAAVQLPQLILPDAKTFKLSFDRFIDTLNFHLFSPEPSTK